MYAWTRPATVFPSGGRALRHQVVYFAAPTAEYDLDVREEEIEAET